jgi:hypothetical protein
MKHKGYTGRVVYVELSERTVESMQVDEKVVRGQRLIY